MSSITRERISSNLVWRLLERCGAQGVSFIVSIVLARLLDPSVYGTIALVLVFTTILQVFVDSGLGNALIQKKDADETDFSTVFYVNVVFCVLLYFIMYIAAPLIAAFYNDQGLIPVVRVLSLTIVISGVKNVQQAYVAKTLQFKRFFWSTLGGTVGAAIVGIWLAYNGYGVWALVIQNILNQSIDTMILWLTVNWRPRLAFSFDRLRKLLGFGSKLLFAKLIDTVYVEIRALVIGKKYSSSDLGYYNKGQQLPKLLVTNIDNAVESVLFPVMSEEQDNIIRVRTLLQRTIQINTYVICPLMAGLAACAEPLIILLLTDKWIGAVIYLRVFCFIYAFTVFNTANMNTYRSLGRSGTYLRVEILRKAIGIILLFLAMNISVYAIALSEVITTLIALVINTYPNDRLIGYGLHRQLNDMAKPIMMSCIMGFIVYCVGFLPIAIPLMLVFQVIIGIISYLALSLVLKPQGYTILLEVFKRTGGSIKYRLQRR